MPPLTSNSTPTPQQSTAEGWRDFGKRIADQALGAARREIQSQLDAARAERQALQGRLDAAQSGSVRRDLQSQLQTTEINIEKLHSVLVMFGATTTVTPVFGTCSGTQPPPFFPSNPRMNVDPTEIVATSLGILFVAFPLTLAIVRFIWKRSTNAPPPPLSQEQTIRFDRLEQSVDAIAIEVERISENQRYLTKLLAEPKQTARVGS
jgi:hypothetical protein